MENEISRSWFSVLNNPAEHGYIGTPQEICKKLKEEWTITDTRSGAWAYCISQDGLHHIHMVLEDKIEMRFTKIKKAYACGMHFESTKGNKNQVEDYINKKGKFEEKGETVVYIEKEGEITGKQGKRTDLENMSQLIEDGRTPDEIKQINPRLYRYEKEMRQMYFDKKSRETPIIRNVNVIWHIGESGSGKSYDRVKLSEIVGEENIYFYTDYTSSGFDNYSGQRILWLEDFKGEMRFGDMLRYLDVYKCQLHCRYSNSVALWNEVHITSVMMPQAVYRRMLDDDKQSDDKIEQLMRRINVIRYHWKDKKGYHYIDEEMKIGLTLCELQEKSRKTKYEEIDISEPLAI